jgi:hypothetical protein
MAASYSEVQTGSRVVHGGSRDLTGRQEDCLSGPDPQQKHPKKYTKKYNTDPQQSADGYFELDLFLLFASAAGHYINFKL